MSTLSLVGAKWRKSSYSDDKGGECVEVAHLPGGVAVRDSKNADGPCLTFPTDSFAHLIRTVALGR